MLRVKRVGCVLGVVLLSALALIGAALWLERA
jgi:hypothetical protein